MTFTRADQATADQWDEIRAAEAGHDQRELSNVVTMLAALAFIADGFAINQLQHSLQTATRAEASGATEPVIVAALLHDVGKPLSLVNHPAVSAELLRGRVDETIVEAVRHHGELLADYSHHTDRAHRRHAGATWFPTAARLASWDQQSFDPDYPTRPLEHFMPMLRRVFESAAAGGLEREVGTKKQQS